MSLEPWQPRMTCEAGPLRFPGAPKPQSQEGTTQETLRVQLFDGVRPPLPSPRLPGAPETMVKWSTNADTATIAAASTACTANAMVLVASASAMALRRHRAIRRHTSSDRNLTDWVGRLFRTRSPCAWRFNIRNSHGQRHCVLCFRIHCQACCRARSRHGKRHSALHLRVSACAAGVPAAPALP